MIDCNLLLTDLGAECYGGLTYLVPSRIVFPLIARGDDPFALATFRRTCYTGGREGMAITNPTQVRKATRPIAAASQGRNGVGCAESGERQQGEGDEPSLFVSSTADRERGTAVLGRERLGAFPEPASVSAARRVSPKSPGTPWRAKW